MNDRDDAARPVPPDQEPGDPELERGDDAAPEPVEPKEADAEGEEARVDAAPREVP